MAHCRYTAAALLFVGFCSAAIFLAGTATLHAACNDDELPSATRIAIFTASGIPGHASCSYEMGWQWLVVIGEITALCVAAYALLSAAACARRAALPAALLLAVWTTFTMHLCASYLALHYTLDSYGLNASSFLTYRGASCCVAGTVLCSVCDLILLVLLACRAQCGTSQDPTSSACCANKTAAPASPAPRATEITADARIPSGTPDATGTAAFLKKTDAAAAAGANLV